jgi:hypothetical protein
MPTVLVDPSGENPAVAYWVLRIGALVTTTAATLSWLPSSDPTFDELKGKTVTDPVDSTSFEASAKEVGGSKDKCSSGSDRNAFVYWRWKRRWPWGSERRIKINVSWAWGAGNVSGSLDSAGTGGTNPQAGFKVVGVTLSVDYTNDECECLKKLPCVNGKVTVRTVYDQPWPIDNIDERWSGMFRVCANGTSSFGSDYGNLEKAAGQ